MTGSTEQEGFRMSETQRWPLFAQQHCRGWARIIFLLFALALPFPVLATVFLQEDFEELKVVLSPAVRESIDPAVLGWTHTPPSGWSIDNQDMGAVPGMPEWQGWSFTTLPFWTSADRQGREGFTRASGVFAVADPDEWDDRGSPSAYGRFNSQLISPAIRIPADTPLFLKFLTIYRQEGSQFAEVDMRWNDGPWQRLLRYDSAPDSDNRGRDVLDEEILLEIPAPAEDRTITLRWVMGDAVNNWFWAIDQIELSNEAPPEIADIAEIGPFVHFGEADGAIRILYETAEAAPTVVNYWMNDQDVSHYVDQAETTRHEVVLQGLVREEIYHYSLAIPTESGRLVSREYTFDTTYDWGPGTFHPGADDHPFDSPQWTIDLCDWVIADFGRHRGLCYLPEVQTGALAYEVAAKSQWRIVAETRERAALQEIRRKLDHAGMLGDRVSVLEKKDPDRFPAHLMNRVIWVAEESGPGLPGFASSLWRTVRPSGGALVLAWLPESGNQPAEAVWDRWIVGFDDLESVEWHTLESGLRLAVLRRGVLSGSGRWTHFYADPGNTACSNDRHANGEVDLRWFGRPGPRLVINRHSRPMSSLYDDGMLFVPGDDRVMVMDAYNGTRLWDLSIPGSRRLGAFKDSGQMVLGSNRLYVAVRDQCVAVDKMTGMPADVFRLPRPQDRGLDWGYLATADGLLIGSAQDEEASFYEYTADGCCDVLEGDDRALTYSEYLFASNRATGSPQWLYKGGAILNSATAISGGRIFFLENDTLPPVASSWEGPGRRSAGAFCGNGNDVVCLDLASGEELWRVPVMLPYDQMLYLSAADGVLLFVGSYNQGSRLHYGLRAFACTDGRSLWSESYDSGFGPGGSHGEQWQRPVIMSGTIYMLNASSYDLQTGARGDFAIQRGAHGCGTISGSSASLFARGSNPRRYPVSEAGTVSGNLLSRVSRPGCFINIIPAGGMVMIPESSSGCTCDYPLQMSLCFAPGN
jgi:outer membrane protein assembly factor BamB